jgi:hypothetical protein
MLFFSEYKAVLNLRFFTFTCLSFSHLSFSLFYHISYSLSHPSPLLALFLLAILPPFPQVSACPGTALRVTRLLSAALLSTVTSGGTRLGGLIRTVRATCPAKWHPVPWTGPHNAPLPTLSYPVLFPLPPCPKETKCSLA